MMLVAKSMAGDTSDKRFVKKALRGVRTIICPNVCTPCRASLNKLALLHRGYKCIDVCKLNESKSIRDGTDKSINLIPINRIC